MAFRRLIVAVFMIFAFAILIQQQAQAEKLIFAHDWVPYGKHANFYAAAEKGFFKAVGLDVQVLRGHGGADTAKRVAQSNINFGFADAPSVIITRSRGGMVKLTGIIADKGMNVVYSLQKSGIRGPKDLSGKTVGDTQNGACITIFPALAKLHGIKNWKHQVMTGAAKNPSLLAGKVDAICTFVTVGPVVYAKGKKLGTPVNTLTFADNGLDMAGAGMVARDETIKKNPGLVRRFNEAVYKATAWTVENPDEGVAVFLRLHPAMNKKLTRQQWEVAAKHLMTETAKKNGIGYMDPAKMKKTVELVVKYGRDVPAVKAETVYTNAFLPKLFPNYKPLM
jgi:NitT/TauT family transport system substrate-binding protein